MPMGESHNTFNELIRKANAPPAPPKAVAAAPAGSVPVAPAPVDHEPSVGGPAGAAPAAPAPAAPPPAAAAPGPAAPAPIAPAPVAAAPAPIAPARVAPPPGPPSPAAVDPIIAAPLVAGAPVMAHGAPSVPVAGVPMPDNASQGPGSGPVSGMSSAADGLPPSQQEIMPAEEQPSTPTWEEWSQAVWGATPAEEQPSTITWEEWSQSVWDAWAGFSTGCIGCLKGNVVDALTCAMCSGCCSRTSLDDPTLDEQDTGWDDVIGDLND
ncbi:actin organization and endocytosis protein [Ptychographa xylographoides]|nr:actin organization and endocytosis protein [Ptychographa xylographoides]